MGSSALVRQLVQEKENSEFKPVKLRLKIDLVSYPARAERLGKFDKLKQSWYIRNWDVPVDSVYELLSKFLT